MKRLLIVFALITLYACNKGSEKTIYLVRHAEKDTYNPKDPALTIEGVMRSVDLQKWFEGKAIDTLISSDTKRTVETAKPLSENRSLEIGIYDPMKFEEVANQLKEIKADTIVMIGHSNTILNQIEAFGAKKPQEEIGEKEYDKIFELQLPSKEVIVHSYGDTID